MASITLIAAIGKNNELGKDNKLLWHIKEDLIYFKSATINKSVILGRKTLESLPGLLPNRIHLVLTHKKLEENEYLRVFNDIDSLNKYLDKIDEEVMVIGGSEIYNLFIDRADKMILTEIDMEKECDKYFPIFNRNEWESKVIYKNDGENLSYKRLIYKRKDI